jgi:hypothetical protein
MNVLRADMTFSLLDDTHRQAARFQCVVQGVSGKNWLEGQGRVLKMEIWSRIVEFEPL